VLISNLHAEGGQWDERADGKSIGIEKSPGHNSFIQVETFII
jgi:hypothetical protein